MKPEDLYVFNQAIDVFETEYERLASDGGKSKNPRKIVSTRYLFLHINLKNIGDGLFKLLEAIEPQQRLNTLENIIKYCDEDEGVLGIARLIKKYKFAATAALMAAGYPYAIYSNLSIFENSKKSLSERAQTLVQIIVALSPEAQALSKKQKINKYDITAYKHNPQEPEEVLIEDVLENGIKKIQEVATVMEQDNTIVANDNDDNKPAEEYKKEQSKEEHQLRTLGQEMDRLQADAAKIFSATCDAAQKYVQAVHKSLKRLHENANFSNKFLPQNLLLEIENLQRESEPMLLKIRTVLTERTPYITGVALDATTIEEYIKITSDIAEKIQGYENEVLKTAQISTSKKSHGIMYSLYENATKLLQMFKEMLCKLKDLAEKVWNILSKQEKNTDKSLNISDKKTLIKHFKKEGKAPGEIESPIKKQKPKQNIKNKSLD